MELREVTRRIFGQHPRLILVAVLAGLGLAAIFHGWSPQTYSRTAVAV